ncbi:MAG: hypothetical protein CME64_14415 [Halobacteriovoraceae bacterium]|nr:hypothetical protein [Halobacteriovoraceae bacterium]|tara:strand:+ start:84873 stop:85652 length:780 start_codon:yes stop_codon:yes gene_type:complete
MRILQVAALIFILASCKAKPKVENSYLQEALTSVFIVTDVNGRLVNASEMDMAPGTWHTAMKLSTRINNFKIKDYCLMVKTPYELEPGKMKFVSLDSESKCSDAIFKEPVDQEFEFYNLMIKLKDNHLTLEFDKNKIEFSFFNIKSNAVELSMESADKGRQLQILKDGDVCRQVADDCTVVKDECDRCENGSYYLKNSSCLSSYSKVCGVDNCGLKNNPACIRGEVSTGVKDYCIQDSPVGFCIGDARVGCVNKTLICE